MKEKNLCGRNDSKYNKNVHLATGTRMKNKEKIRENK